MAFRTVTADKVKAGDALLAAAGVAREEIARMRTAGVVA